MKRAGLMAMAALLLVPAAAFASTGPAVHPTASVTVGPGGSAVFDPHSVQVRLGGAVTWTWASSGHSVTDDSGFGLFDSGALGSGATFSYAFQASATHSYASTPDPGMTGVVRVPIRVHPSTGDERTRFRLTWALAPQPDIYYHVKGRVDGSRWGTYSDGSDLSFIQVLSDGTWDFKARLVNQNTGAYSAWSPILTIVVTG